MYTKLISRMVLSTQEKSSSTATLRYSCPRRLPKITRKLFMMQQLFKIGFSHGKSFLMFAKFPERLLNFANNLLPPR